MLIYGFWDSVCHGGEDMVEQSINLTYMCYGKSRTRERGDAGLNYHFVSSLSSSSFLPPSFFLLISSSSLLLLFLSLFLLSLLLLLFGDRVSLSPGWLWL